MTTQQRQTPATIMERDMLKTRVPERDMAVVTYLRFGADHERGCPPWTVVWEGQEQRTRVRWLHFWRGSTTPGGLQEAHASVVAQVRAGTLPKEEER